MNLYFFLRISLYSRAISLWYLANFLNAIDLGDAYTANLAIYKHFASATFADTTFKTAVASIKAVTVNWKSSLMQSCCYSFSTLTFNCLSFVLKLHKVFCGDFKNRMPFNFIHSSPFCVFELTSAKVKKTNKIY